MKLFNRTASLVLGSVLALSAAAAYADDYGTNANAGASSDTRSGAKGGQSGPYIGIGAGSARNSVVHDRSTAAKAFVGYDFNKNFGVEGGYVDLGIVDNGSEHIGRRSPYVDGVIRMPFSYGVNLFAKGGVHYSNTSSTIYGRDHDTDATYGAGLSYDFAPNVGTRVEWERFEQKRGRDDLVSASLVFKFM